MGIDVCYRMRLSTSQTKGGRDFNYRQTYVPCRELRVWVILRRIVAPHFGTGTDVGMGHEKTMVPTHLEGVDQQNETYIRCARLSLQIVVVVR